jgi:predicted MFS family arabinose efflux permease
LILWLLAVAAGATVANLYYSQPLLGLIGAQLGASPRMTGLVSTLTQAGYGAGMLLLVPLGDARERRSLLVGSALASSVALLAAGFAPDIGWLLLASFAVGLAAVAPQLSVTFAAALTPGHARGQSLGKVTSGLLVGVLLSRVFSGAVGDRFGWRSIYFLGAPLMVLLAALLRFALPRQHPSRAVRYGELLASLPGLVRREPLLRRHAILGACTFASFSVFWTTLAFALAAPPFHYGSAVAGLFGLVGAGGALVAPVAGRAADRYGSRAVNLAAMAVVLVSWLLFALAGRHLLGLAAGVVLLDLGVQANHISNQTRVLGLSGESLNRLNTVYMVAYFAGGALGSAAGGTAWAAGGWIAVCAAGAAFSTAGLIAFFAVSPESARRIETAEALR